jgi:opacity protein-like surface antigen
LAGYQFTPHFAIEARANLGVKDYSETYLGETFKIEINNSLSAFFKASYPVNDQFSVYGLAGFNNTKYKISISDSFFSASGSETESGFAYGAGAEFVVNANWSFAVEYVALPELLSDLDASNFSFLARYRF